MNYDESIKTLTCNNYRYNIVIITNSILNFLTSDYGLWMTSLDIRYSESKWQSAIEFFFLFCAITVCYCIYLQKN